MTWADSVATLGVDFRTRVKRSGAKEKARMKKCNVRFSFIKKKKAFQMVLARTWRVHAVGMAATERLKLRRQMAAAAGKKSTTSLSLCMEGGIRPSSGGRALYHCYSVLGRRSLDLKMELRAKRRLDEADSRSSDEEAS